MANLSETATFPSGIYQIEQTDPVLGGAPNPATGAGMVNIPHQQLAQRTAFLKQQLDAIEAELEAHPLAGLAPLQSPGFTGQPSAPTPPLGNSSTRIATTAFVSLAFGSSLGNSGWQRLSSGLIIQWGGGSYDAQTGADGTVITLPLAFPNAFYRVIAGDVGSGVNTVAAQGNGLTSARFWARTPGGSFANTVINWTAFGR